MKSIPTVVTSLCLLFVASCTSSCSIRRHSWIDNQLYSVQGSLYKNIARIKNPTKSIVRFSPDQVQEIKSLLKPGDILLSFTDGYMSNVFLPGNFKHSITYIGDVEDRKKLGITEESLSINTTDQEQLQKVIMAAHTKQIPTGEEADVIEAVAEGVRLYSLERLLATHINRLVALRPRISKEQTKNQIIGLFSYLGTPYDFRFDFSDASRNCCSELIYRTLEPNGPFHFELIKQSGHMVLNADGIANYYLNNPSDFEFVLLADEGNKNGRYNAAVHVGEEGSDKLRKLMRN